MHFKSDSFSVNTVTWRFQFSDSLNNWLMFKCSSRNHTDLIFQAPSCLHANKVYIEDGLWWWMTCLLSLIKQLLPWPLFSVGCMCSLKALFDLVEYALFIQKLHPWHRFTIRVSLRDIIMVVLHMEQCGFHIMLPTCTCWMILCISSAALQQGKTGSVLTV